MHSWIFVINIFVGQKMRDLHNFDWTYIKFMYYLVLYIMHRILAFTKLYQIFLIDIIVLLLSLRFLSNKRQIFKVSVKNIIIAKFPRKFIDIHSKTVA